MVRNALHAAPTTVSYLHALNDEKISKESTTKRKRNVSEKAVTEKQRYTVL